MSHYLPVIQVIVGQGGDLTDQNINASVCDIKTPCRRVTADLTHSVTIQYTENMAIIEMSSEVIKS